MMTSNYYDGCGNRVNRERYQRLILNYLRRRVGPSPYIENPYTQVRHYVQIPLIRRRQLSRQRTATRRSQRYMQPESAISSSCTNCVYKSNTERIQFQNQQHPLQQLKQDLENEVSIEDLQEQLNTLPKPASVDHDYNINNEWNYVEGDCNSLDHPFHSWKDNTSKRTKQIKERYFQTLKMLDEPVHSTRLQRHMKEINYYMKTLPRLPFRKYNNICLEKLASQSQYSFNKRMKQYQGSELDDYIASTITPTNTKHFAVDKNNIVIYIYLPGAITSVHQDRMSLAVLKLLMDFPNQKPKSTDKRHTNHNDISVYHLLDWCPTGHKKQKCISRQSIGNGKVTAMDSIISTTQSMESVREKAAVIMELVDSEMHLQYLNATDNGTLAYQKLLRACIQDVYLGCVLNTGRVKNHRDWNDVFRGLSAMSPIGHFVGGDLVFPQIGVRLVYSSGALVMCSTQSLEHFITQWFGIRVGTVHCSHEARVGFKKFLHENDCVFEPPCKKRKLIK